MSNFASFIATNFRNYFFVICNPELSIANLLGINGLSISGISIAGDSSFVFACKIPLKHLPYGGFEVILKGFISNFMFVLFENVFRTLGNFFPLFYLSMAIGENNLAPFN